MDKKDKELTEMLEAKFDEIFEEMFGEKFDSEEDSSIIILNDEAGNEVEFEFLDLIEYNGEEYVILLPAGDDDTGEVVILKVDGEGSDGESYSSVDDDGILMAVFNIFKEKFKDEFNFVD